MRVRAQILIQLWIVLGSLLLGQVGAGFFHNKHDAHKITRVLAPGEYAIQEHGEHCKLCAIDLIQLYAEPLEACGIQEPAKSIFVVGSYGSPSASASISRGRSPPFMG